MTLENIQPILNSIHKDLYRIKKFVYDKCGFVFTNFKAENESVEYGACTFELNNFKIKYRVSKITPAKTGQFVTIWKRNNKGVTEPFNISDDIDLLIITAKSSNNFGQFIFPKDILVRQKIITGNTVEGKRGIRVYPPWDKVTSKQAEKTQKWQSEYFIPISKDNSFDMTKAKKIISKI
ncbi:MAG: MepB family protein [Bacteroidia bacterium]